MARKQKISTFDSYCTKRVSYILVTKNRARLLKKALEMAKKLKGRNDELIVVDGNSTDGTTKVIKSFGKIVDKYICEGDIGPTHAANKAIMISNGKYIKLISDDDIFYEKSMAMAILVLEKYSEIDVLVCGGVSYNKITKSYHTFYKPPGTNFGKNIDDIFNYKISGVGLIIKRSVFSKVGLFPANSLISDAQFIANCFLNGAVVKYCRIKLFKFNIHGSNTSLNPKISRLLYDNVRDHASKKLLLRYAFNWYLNRYPVLKLFFLPLILPMMLIKSTLRLNTQKRDDNYIWDGGFS